LPYCDGRRLCSHLEWGSAGGWKEKRPVGLITRVSRVCVQAAVWSKWVSSSKVGGFGLVPCAGLTLVSGPSMSIKPRLRCRLSCGVTRYPPDHMRRICQLGDILWTRVEIAVKRVEKSNLPATQKISTSAIKVQANDDLCLWSPRNHHDR
jgi:hypothetical protein